MSLLWLQIHRVLCIGKELLFQPIPNYSHSLELLYLKKKCSLETQDRKFFATSKVFFFSQKKCIAGINKNIKSNKTPFNFFRLWPNKFHSPPSSICVTNEKSHGQRRVSSYNGINIEIISGFFSVIIFICLYSNYLRITCIPKSGLKKFCEKNSSVHIIGTDILEFIAAKSNIYSTFIGFLLTKN